MSRFGRRAFLSSSAGVAAGAVAAGAMDGTASGPGAGAGAGAAERVVGMLDAPLPRPGPLRANGLTVNGLTDPVGVDPDDCSFAWTLHAKGRGAAQTSYRVRVLRTDAGHTGTVWDSGAVESARQAFVSYAGPTLAGDAAYRWTVQARAPGATWGPVSAPAHFTTGLRAGDWGAATWLTPAAGPGGPDRVTYLRSEFTPPAGTLVRATAYVSAAHTYRLYVDGAPVDAWPSFSYPDEQYVRAVDLTSAVRPARSSAIGVLHRWYGAGQGRPASSPGLIFLLALHYADGSRVVHVSDGQWVEHPSEWLPSPQRNADSGDFVEWVDGRAHPAGWSSTGFDDRSWSPPAIGGFAGTPPFTATFAQRTTIRETPVSPVRVRTLANGAVVADFGAVYAARPRVTFASGEAGRTVAMRVGYLLDPDGQVSTLHGTQETNLSMSYIMRSGTQTFEGFTYLGFRYLQVDAPPGPLRADDMVAIARHAAMPDVPAATFVTDDRMLNAVWKLCARSCLFCSQEQFVDTPTREKGPFLWDGANESEGVMRAYGDRNMTWQALRDIARGQARYWPQGQVNAVYPNGDGARTFGTSTARYPEWLWRYAVSTGDLATVRALYPSVTRAVTWLWSTRQITTGLLYGLADTDNGDPVYGYDLSVAADTVSNVLAVNAMRRLAQLATMTGDDAASPDLADQIRPTGRLRQRCAAAPRRHLRRRRRQQRRAERPRLAGGQCAGARLRRRAGLRPRRGRGVRRGPRHRRGAQPRSRAPARVGGGGHARGDGAHAHRHVHAGLGPHCGGRWHLHLGGLATERPDRGLHVTRLGLLRAGGHAGDPARGRARGTRSGRHHPGRRFTAVGRPGPCPRLGADHRRARAGLVATPGQGHGDDPDGAGERGGDGAVAHQRTVERP